MLTLARKIQLALAVIGISLLLTTVIYFYNDEKNMAEDYVAINLESIAQNYFDSVNTMMLTGTTANRKIFQDKILSQDNIVEAKIIRGDLVKKLYGNGFSDQVAIDSFEQDGLKGLQGLQIIKKDNRRIMQFVMPMVASKDYRGTDCLGCHQAKEGDVLGAVKVSYDLSASDKKIQTSIIKAGILQLLVTLTGFGILGYLLHRLIFMRINRLKGHLSNIERDLDLGKALTIHHDDELSALSKAVNSLMAKFKESLVEVSQATHALTASAKDVNEISLLTKDAVLAQKAATESVAAAINELDASANEVESHTKYAAEKSIEADKNASQGLTIAKEAHQGINSLREQVQDNSQKISELGNKTTEVGTVLEVITQIAEQTNLLALNAAIEAARAGEQGRGFAVVADEVRSLATRTSDSIDEIQKTILSLQQTAGQAVESMHNASQQADEKAENVANVSNLLDGIAVQIKELDGLNTQISSAAHQQNIAAEEINVNVVNISNVAEQSAEDAIRGQEISEQLLGLAKDLEQQVSRFKL
ncbi:methyl-accepting chemotaxis protein [Psychrobium sp. 1_MG-2023]|uniref:methyl-accepting chemotaxis protein n=1 Tax=Psychrobium sp. 1_MG-2023 TaxID=3062624 RepID=UPI000C335B83|nr:methyl-accepting chemotaxis protein [Psychrobium sp. 1_MG-2023]MDP2561147.1 methyl-accepting chemotaxis protein [Psychrobium sp. 1_MG-2023]PKF55122.1 methyl-accepting chemotaxis protein [Alteromonadales bacterium alter-6D02]